MMKCAIVLSALAIVGVHAQGEPKGAPKGGTNGGAKGGAGAKGGSGNAGIMSALGSLFGENGVPLGPAPKGCSAYEVIIARGTFEPGSFGTIVGDPLMRVIKKDMSGKDVRGYAVQYPAKMGGADIGIKDVVNRVTTKAKECPNQKFALVGYSQGGMVVSAAAPKIPTDLQEKVVAMVLYGAGTGAVGAKGGSSPSDAVKQKTLANCAPGDMCGNPIPSGQSQGAMTGHLSYANQGTSWHARSSKYIVAAFNGQARGYKLELSPN
jgi:cutinase